MSGFAGLFAQDARVACGALRAVFRLHLLLIFFVSTIGAVVAPPVQAAPAAHDVSGHDGGHDHHKAAHEPCDHGQDCSCHDRDVSPCCAQAGAVAAIWMSVSESRRLVRERFAGTEARRLRSAILDPPTPPPRLVLS
jgi:hypothetical protein